MRVFSGRELCRLLSEHGFTQARQRGSHIIMQRRVGRTTVTVPVPDHREIKVGTLQSIIRQSQLSRELFEVGSPARHSTTGQSLQVIGVERVEAIISGREHTAKMVFNENGAVFGPVSTEHRDLSGLGICYAENYKGNALAAIVTADKIEVRFHQSFSDAKVTAMIGELLARAELAGLRGCELTYQGRRLAV